VDRSGKRGFDIWARLGTAGLGEMIMQAHWETGRPVTPGLVDRPDESTTCPWKAPLDGFHAPKSLLLQPTGAALAKLGALGSGTGQARKKPETLKKRGCRRRREGCVSVRAWASVKTGSPVLPLIARLHHGRRQTTWWCAGRNLRSNVFEAEVEPPV
jgi:hypothetical protein